MNSYPFTDLDKCSDLEIMRGICGYYMCMVVVAIVQGIL